MIKKFNKIIATFLFFSPFTVFAQDITIIFKERTPYVQKDQNSITGLVATPLINALNNAQINYELKEKPSKRHLFEIKADLQPLCAVGWFKNPQREEYAKFTKPAYQDKPMGIIKRKADTKINSSMNLETLLGQKDIKLLGKKSYSYGKDIDKTLAKFHVKRLDVSSSNVQMYTLIAKKRADFMFSSFEEASELLEDHPLKNSLEFISLKDMPKGSNRYLICSKKVDDLTIEKINKFLP